MSLGASIVVLHDADPILLVVFFRTKHSGTTTQRLSYEKHALKELTLCSGAHVGNVRRDEVLGVLLLTLK